VNRSCGQERDTDCCHQPRVTDPHLLLPLVELLRRVFAHHATGGEHQWFEFDSGVRFVRLRHFVHRREEFVKLEQNWIRIPGGRDFQLVFLALLA